RYSNSDIGASNYDENLHGAIVRKTTMSFLTVCPDSFTVMMSRSIYRSPRGRVKSSTGQRKSFFLQPRNV
ncbi:MAG TPA: hypothetical protein VEQ38_26995, partial [Verrucomicrobiae bacterium]|nr:hypothetical protein [Verrucomicrobiae bacterium]